MSRNTSRKGTKKPPATKKPVPCVDSIRVRDCMVWPDPSYKQQEPTGERTQRFLPRKAELGRPKDRGYIMPEDTEHQLSSKRDEEGTVIEALRGWPNATPEDEDEYYGYSGDQQPPEADRGHPEKCHTGRGEPDPPMPYLMEHRYMYKPEEKQAAGSDKRGASGGASRAKASIKGTTSSQLRAIHISNKMADNDPLKNRKIPSKLQKVPPHLDTFRRDEKKGKNKENHDDDISGDKGVCTCYDVNGPQEPDFRFDSPELADQEPLDIEQYMNDNGPVVGV